jgi:hypothetical protein
MSVAAACVDFSSHACFPLFPLFHHLLRNFVLRRCHNRNFEKLSQPVFFFEKLSQPGISRSYLNRGFSTENPPVEITPDFAHESCKGSGEEVIGEIHWGKEDGLAPCTFPGLCNYDC